MKRATAGARKERERTRAPRASPYSALEAYDEESGDLHVVIETPKGSRNKLRFDPNAGVFRLRRVLPSGAVFPFDFGFVPSTLAQDGDPLDVLVLMDEPTAVGCLVDARAIGVIRASEARHRGEIRNDRVIAVATQSLNHGDVRSLRDVNHNLLAEIEHFFVSYNEARSRSFRTLGLRGPREAERLIREAVRRASAQGAT